MRRLCKNCVSWKKTMLHNQGYCSRDKVYRSSLYLCGQFEGRPPTLRERAGEFFDYCWENTGRPTFDAATQSRKTLEMLIVFTLMIISFIFMSIMVYPALKKAAVKAFSSSVTEPGD